MAQRKYKHPELFDTLSYAKKLQAAGFTQAQAEVQAETFLSIVQEQLVSKRDLKEVEKELTIKIETVRNELKVDIEKVRLEIENVRKDLGTEIANVNMKIALSTRDLKIWFGSMLVVTVGVLTGMMTLIAHLTH